MYIAGLHNGELPHDPASIKDLEICKFVVAFTRTRKKCTLIRTRKSGQSGGKGHFAESGYIRLSP